LSEMSQAHKDKNTSTACCHSDVNLKKLNSHQLRVDWWVPESEEWQRRERRKERWGKFDQWVLSYN
jgi:hypothetical protein